ncbi:acetyl-CoA carboxylase family protein [Smaragdicoccus niigatensis]|uniref:acetyl-CoA carboxylase family protein n=1 Tax=Smaragdicoccus niigatensis TaxID=359359 RepID=UPI000368A485|nr:carboxyl transferase domain-containing protein [Smaragdicoccus niigatensis]
MNALPPVVIANRGEIAVRVLRTARELGHRVRVLHSPDDRDSLAVRMADDAVELSGRGPAAYLDVAGVTRAAGHEGLLHPGYGFLSESADLAEECAKTGLVFVGPAAHVLRTFGDKVAARQQAVAAGIDVLPGTPPGSGFPEIAALLAAHADGIMIKALAGGGGRGMRAVTDPNDLKSAYERCRSEALAGFGDDSVFAEVLAHNARHIEVQVVADGTLAIAVGDRDCSIQRRHQKLIEIAPAPSLSDALRERLHSNAVRIIESVGYRGVATVEFLVRREEAYFLEVNPRLQVEHTVTEQVTGIDLVAVQLALASGSTLADLQLQPVPRGHAIQARVNAERIMANGDLVPSVGTLTRFSPPTGPGVRVDTAGFPGLEQSPMYDSLLAKVITSGGSLNAALRRCLQALSEFDISGVETNLGLLRALLDDPAWGDSQPITTTWLADRLPDLVTHPAEVAKTPAIADGEFTLRTHVTGVVVWLPSPHATIASGDEAAVIEAMKMEHVVRAEQPLEVVRTVIEPGTVVEAGAPLFVYRLSSETGTGATSSEVDLHRLRDDLAEVENRHRLTRDEARSAAVAKRHRLGRRTARENIADLVDDGSFVEYGALAIAAQRLRRSEEDLIANTPADGLVTGIATINGDRAAVLSYDYTVLAGTQGMRNHAKTDRLLDLAHDQSLPVVLFAEGGGGRPGDTDQATVSGLDLMTFHTMGSLSGRVPLVGIVSGRCFAGNAALLGTCDVVIATPDANVGMGGPAMIEGGGLGVFAPEDIGPIDIQRRNGVVHVVAEDEADAVDIARRYLGYFQGALPDWQAPDPRLARHVIPENRLRSYDVRAAIDAIVDAGSVLELRRDWGVGVVTALVRVEGRPYGLVANDNHHLGGAIDAPAADKLSAFLQLCNAHRLPIVSLCDTPGFMVGPEAEKHATVTKFSRLFIDGANLTVPLGTVILRKGYGLGAMAMTAGSFRAPRFVVAWPTGEVGGMGLEGAVRLGFRKELEAIADPIERQTAFDNLVAMAYASGKALTAASVLELDDVIDPAETRRWISTLADAQG